MKEVEVVVIKYESDDGDIWETKEEAIHRDKMRSGERKKCTICNGSGKEPDCENRNYHKCSSCNGKGWLEKVEVWK